MTAQRYLESTVVGDRPDPVEFGPITSRNLVQWAAAAGDYHEIHYDQEYARAQGLPDIVVHGPLKLALMGRLLLSVAGSEGWICRMTCRYGALDVPGTRFRCEAVVTAVRPESGEVDLDLKVINEKGQATAQGTGTVRLPPRTAATA